MFPDEHDENDEYDENVHLPLRVAVCGVLAPVFQKGTSVRFGLVVPSPLHPRIADTHQSRKGSWLFEIHQVRHFAQCPRRVLCVGLQRLQEILRVPVPDKVKH